MSSVWGNNLRLSIFGESHSAAIGCSLDGFPAGTKIDMEKLLSFMARRSSKGGKTETPRIEKDFPNIISGVLNGFSCGTPICCVIENKNTKSRDYDGLRTTPRPSHADFTGNIKYNGFNDQRGGGHFSGRLTAPLVFAGGLCEQLLEEKGIRVYAKIRSIKNVSDEEIDIINPDEKLLKEAIKKEIPCVSMEKAREMEDIIISASKAGDSVGGVVECFVLGLEPGVGSPIFDSIESVLSSILFSIPGVKGVEFGKGFSISELFGSEANDSFFFEDERVKTKTNNSGGINGGISNGMPIYFRVAMRPTPSISKQQETVNLKTKENSSLEIKGRHDPCIVKRAVVCVESACALAITDLLLEK